MNMHKKITAAITVVCLLLITSVVFAQYSGPSAGPSYKSVADVLRRPVDDMPVTLEGYLVKRLTDDKYIFSDGTGKIRVDIDHKYFPAGPVNEKTKVRIHGELDKEFMRKPEIDVKSMIIVN